MNGICPHSETVPVEQAITGETVALLCATCGDQLPVNWHCPDCEVYFISATDRLYPIFMVTTLPCPRHRELL